MPLGIDEYFVEAGRALAAQFDAAWCSALSSTTLVAKERNNKMRSVLHLDTDYGFFDANQLKKMDPIAVCQVAEIVRGFRILGAKGKLLKASTEPMLRSLRFTPDGNDLTGAMTALDLVMEAYPQEVKDSIHATDLA